MPQPPAAETAYARVPELHALAVAALGVPPEQLRAASDVGAAPCDDTSSVENGADLVRVSMGQQVDAPAGDAAQLVERTAAALSQQYGWPRDVSPVSQAWQLLTEDDYAIVLAPVSADMLAVQAVSPCARP